MDVDTLKRGITRGLSLAKVTPVWTTDQFFINPTRYRVGITKSGNWWRPKETNILRLELEEGLTTPISPKDIVISEVESQLPQGYHIEWLLEEYNATYIIEYLESQNLSNELPSHPHADGNIIIANRNIYDRTYRNFLFSQTYNNQSVLSTWVIEQYARQNNKSKEWVEAQIAKLFASIGLQMWGIEDYETKKCLTAPIWGLKDLEDRDLNLNPTLKRELEKEVLKQSVQGKVMGGESLKVSILDSQQTPYEVKMSSFVKDTLLKSKTGDQSSLMVLIDGESKIEHLNFETAKDLVPYIERNYPTLIGLNEIIARIDESTRVELVGYQSLSPSESGYDITRLHFALGEEPEIDHLVVEILRYSNNIHLLRECSPNANLSGFIRNPIDPLIQTNNDEK